MTKIRVVASICYMLYYFVMTIGIGMCCIFLLVYICLVFRLVCDLVWLVWGIYSGCLLY